MERRVLLQALALAALPGLAQAGAVYRCGPDGRSYADAPCAGGRAIAAADPRSAAERREGEAVARSDARLAAALEHERRQAEARLRPGPAVSIGAKPSGPADAPAALSPRQPRRSVRATTPRR